MVLKRDRVFLLIVFTMVMLVLTACGGESQSSNAEEVDAEQSQEGTEEWPEQLTIGVVPSEDQTTVSDRVQNFADELSEHLDMDVEVFLGTDYNAVVEAMRTENIDIAFFGPFAYVLANERSGAEVFSVGAEYEEDVTYTSVVIVPKDSEAESVEDLKGKDFLFVDPASTSGHIFPRVKIMEELDVTNDEVESVFNNVTFSGLHDAPILAIANGDADGAAVATDVMDAMLDQGVVKEDDFNIISESDPIPRGPDAYRSNLPDDLKEEIREFYYDYEDEKFFEERGINGFYPIEDEAYDVVRDAADALGMSPEELLE